MIKQNVEFPVGVDLEFRPDSYFWPKGLANHLLSRIKGAARVAELRAMIESGRLDEIPSYLARSELSDQERQTIGRLHPMFLGGEFLPEVKQEEVIIARVEIASVTQDVTCVYARRGKTRIHYRVVDEYDGGTLSGKNYCTSTHPLTLGALEQFFNQSWSIFNVLAMNFSRDGYPVERMLRFVNFGSQFYTDIGRLYEYRIRVWAAERREARRSTGEGAPSEMSTNTEDDELKRLLEIAAEKTAANDRENLPKDAELHKQTQELSEEELETRAFQRHVMQGRLSGKPRPTPTSGPSSEPFKDLEERRKSPAAIEPTPAAKRPSALVSNYGPHAMENAGALYEIERALEAGERKLKNIAGIDGSPRDPAKKP